MQSSFLFQPDKNNKHKSTLTQCTFSNIYNFFKLILMCLINGSLRLAPSAPKTRGRASLVALRSVCTVTVVVQKRYSANYRILVAEGACFGKVLAVIRKVRNYPLLVFVCLFVFFRTRGLMVLVYISKPNPCIFVKDWN